MTSPKEEQREGANTGRIISDTHKPMMAGGKRPEELVADHVRDAIQQHKQHIFAKLSESNDKSHNIDSNTQTFEPLKQRTQVVAGTKYHVKVRTDNDKYLHVGLWRKLDNTYEVTDARPAQQDEEL